ncbi:MAG: acyl-CoA dehydrogenase family protein, partial [Methyloceanibacter sp.]
KTLASQTMRLVGRDMIQLHGGMGMTDEHDIGLFLKRGRALELAWGASAYHQDRFARIKGF